MTLPLLAWGAGVVLAVLKCLVLSLRDDVSFWRGAGWLAVLFVLVLGFLREFCTMPLEGAGL